LAGRAKVNRVGKALSRSRPFAVSAWRSILVQMVSQDRPFCPACFFALPPLKPEEHWTKCPRCGHILAPRDELQETAAHTPVAKRRSSRPGDD